MRNLDYYWLNRKNMKNANEVKEEMVAWIRDYFQKSGDENTKALIGISGGKDSAVVAAACVAALGKDRVIGVMMPNGVQSDIADSQRICQILGIQNYTINIGNAYDALSEEILTKVGGSLTPQYKTNTPSRLRMVSLYGIAALIGNCRISNNGNKSERLMGYFTIWGDGAGDFAPLAHLYVSEVIAVGKALGLPAELVEKAPSDGMSGKTDEENLGFSYESVEKVQEGDTAGLSPEMVAKIQKRIAGMSWKVNLLNLPNFKPSSKK